MVLEWAVGLNVAGLAAVPADGHATPAAVAAAAAVATATATAR